MAPGLTRVEHSTEQLSRQSALVYLASGNWAPELRLLEVKNLLRIIQHEI